MASIKISELAQKAIRAGRQIRSNRSLADVTRSIPQERKARYIRLMRRLLDGKR